MAVYLYDDAGTLYDTALYDSVPTVLAVGQPKVELLLNSVWTEVTVFVRVEDGIQVQRGRADESSSPVPATCSLVFDNADGRFTPSYTSGAYYPYVVRNTQLRVSVLLDDLVTYSVRFWGEVAEWPISFDYTGTDVRVSVTASGPRRRLARQAIPTLSAYTTAMAGQAAVLAYWPMEDGDSSTSFGNALGGVPGSFTAGVDTASDETWAASDPLPVFSGTTETASFTVPAYTPSVSGQQVRFWARVPTIGTSGTFVVLIATSGAHYFRFEYDAVSGFATTTMRNVATDAVEGTSGGIGANTWMVPGNRISLTLLQNGTGIDLAVTGYTPGNSTPWGFGPITFASATLGFITGVGVANTSADVVSTFGQLSVENHISDFFDIGALIMSAYDGETAYARATRLEPTAVMTGTAASSELMGVQQKATALDLFDEAAYVDGGIATESVPTFALAWRTRASMLSQNAAPLLSLVRLTGFDLTTDDQGTQNDVTVTRTNGASARRMATSGLTSAAVGLYAAGYDLSLHLDSQAGPQAEWRLAVGSLDQPRYPVVAFDAVTGLTSGIRTDLVTLREGGTFSMTSTGGAYLGLTSPTVMRCLGWSETFMPGQWLWSINATHGAPFTDVFILDSATLGVLDTNRLGM